MGTPRSLQAAPRGRDAWKKQVIEAAKRDIDSETESIQFVDLSIRIVHLCEDWGDTDGDLDNIAKPILDALCDSRKVLFNDNQVKDIHLRRIEWKKNDIARIERATERLADALDMALSGDGPAEFVYIFVTSEFSPEVLP
ncbi:MAG: RusA family crossover junction endodeoxyribonuclease [Deltaproteobacteria bacterium]|nr:RusA family crossover junction endodeoxyribonuclease [Deltaproteobacteria bacterium]